MNRDELNALPAVIDVVTAGKVIGIGRSNAYELIRRNQFPIPVLHVGKLIKVPTAPLLQLLGLGTSIGPDSTPADPGSAHSAIVEPPNPMGKPNATEARQSLTPSRRRRSARRG
jgi:hypothetical protein